MRTATLSALLALSMIGALTGCASAPPAGAPAHKSTAVERGSDSKPYDFRSEGKIPPLTPADAPNEPDVEEMGVTETPIDVTDSAAPPDTAPKASAAPADMLVDGFRVQVFASADREIAENASRGAEDRLNIPSYVDLDGGMYKVRVGNFTTRAQADQALGAIRREYADAWVVASKVRAPRAP
jgi:cell division septation protein DedD